MKRLFYKILLLISMMLIFSQSVAGNSSLILSSANTFDRIFVVKNRTTGSELWERRWVKIKNSWEWFFHSEITNLFKNNGDKFELGPMLCDLDLKDKCRLYLHASSNLWYIYNFDKNYSSNSLNSVNITNRYVQCNSNLEFDAYYNIYCASESQLLGFYSITMYKYDYDLVKIKSGSVGTKVTKFSDYINADEKSENPCVISNDSTFSLGGNLAFKFSGSSLQGAVQNRNWIAIPYAYLDVSDRIYNRCFFMRKNYDLHERYYDPISGDWIWINHGRPIKKSDIDSYAFGSMRRLNDAKLLFILDTSYGSRVYERWYHPLSGWFWSDHGYPWVGQPIAIGVALNDSFFVLTASGRLVLRQYRYDLNQWVWQDHGIPM